MLVYQRVKQKIDQLTKFYVVSPGFEILTQTKTYQVLKETMDMTSVPPQN